MARTPTEFELIHIRVVEAFERVALKERRRLERLDQCVQSSEFDSIDVVQLMFELEDIFGVSLLSVEPKVEVFSDSRRIAELVCEKLKQEGTNFDGGEF